MEQTPQQHSSLTVRLEQYEGPLDLLLDLIRKQKIDIRDIPIAKITAQYLEYLQKARELDIELSSDFIYMAATLIHIKSRMLLPRDPELRQEDEPEDPRQELVERLIEYERYKQAAQMLKEKLMVEENVWSRPRFKELAEEDGDYIAVDLVDLVRAFQQVLERVRGRLNYEVEGEAVTVPQMIRYLHGVFAVLPAHETVKAEELFQRQKTIRALICLFLAILELVRLQALQVVQKELFGEILLKRSAQFDQVFQSAQLTDTLENFYR